MNTDRVAFIIIQVIAPGAARRYAPLPPMAVRLAADLRPSADGSAVHTGSQRAYSLRQLRAYGSCAVGQTDRQTDGSWYRLIPRSLRRGINR